MVGVIIEQRIVVKFHFRLGKTATETYNLLKCTAVNFYPVHEFLNSSNVLKMADKTLKMIRGQVALQRQKRMTMSKKLLV